ncbi:MAG: PAS domain-containing protein [Rubrimonas sp.]
MWADLRGARPAPFRAELDAGRIGSRAPYLSILEHVGPSNFRIRIAGDRLNRWFGLELRGMSALSMIDGPSRNHVQAALNRVVGDPAVALVRGEARALDGRSARFEFALLPMRSDFGRIDRVLCGLWLLEAQAAAYPFLLEVDEVAVFPVTDQPLRPSADSAVLTPASAVIEAARAEIARVDGASPASADGTDGRGGAADLRASLRAIDGPQTSTAPARRGHLRLVKD